MIRDSDDADLLRLLATADAAAAASRSANPAAPAPAAAASASSSTSVAAAGSGPSWLRDFFQPIDDCTSRCILPPDPMARTSQPHTAIVSNDLTALRRHITESTHHALAHTRYLEKKRSGLSSEAAARAVIEEAAERGERMKFSFARDPAGEKRLQAEIALLCWIAEKGISFDAMESPYLHAYHKVYQWQGPPGRKRLSSGLLTTVYQLVLDFQRDILKQVEFFSITADSCTNNGHRFVALTAHFVDSDWCLRTACLGVIPLDVSHTWTNLTTAVSLRIKAALPANATLAATVTDGGSNFLKLAASMHTNLDDAEIDGRSSLLCWCFIYL
jgi:hypothetical protein